MGTRLRGGIDSHLDELRLAAVRWLEYENAPNVLAKEDQLLQMSLANEPPPDQPEPLALLRQLRRLGVNYNSGGYYNQPNILIQEFNACMDAEVMSERLQLANILLEKQTQAKKDATSITAGSME